MARSPSIEPTSELEDFISKLRDFHHQRGTLKTFDSQPKVGTPARRVDLLKLYRRVVADGGYDQVSNTRSHKLYWRNLGQELRLGDQNLPGLAFNLKSAYYKNLVAYEIVHVHKKNPPPKEILEELSAKGGDVMTRSMDNFHRPMSRDGALVNGNHLEAEDDEGQNTPAEKKEEGEGGIGRRLRHAPAQRQLFQADMTLNRQTRQSSASQSSPAPAAPYAGAPSQSSYTQNGMPSSLAAYEPRQPQPLQLRPVHTPANNYEWFKNLRKHQKDQATALLRKMPPKAPKVMPPGTGFPGPSIYTRALLALQSGVLEEQEYALHHLVKISHERGDKYRFDGFQGLAEALINKVLEAGELFAESKWKISYKAGLSKLGPDSLDGVNGTSNILKKVQNPRKRKLSDRIEEQNFSRRLNLINEAGLVIRNMVMLEENCDYLARLPPVKDMIILILNLPQHSALVELRHNIFELTEQVAKFYPTYEGDVLFQTLLSSIDSPDRAQIIISLRSICRLGSSVGQLARLSSVPLSLIQLITNWVLVEDEELRSACLDFLFQYTVLPENVASLSKVVPIPDLVKQLVRLLLHNPVVNEREEASKPRPVTPPTPITEIPIPRIPQDLVDQLLVHEEPERSSHWLRSCFEEDSAGEITQIALWQAYQIPFAPYSATRPLLPAKDFITNVSNTFASASAQVMNSTGPAPRFVIKGIKARKVPVDPKGRSYMHCRWHIKPQPPPAAPGQPINPAGLPVNPYQPSEKKELVECGEFALWPKHLWEHIVSKHLGVNKDEATGKYDFTGVVAEKVFTCRWAGGCARYKPSESSSSSNSPNTSRKVTKDTAFAIGMHLKTHLPDASDAAFRRGKHNTTRKASAAASSSSTASDDNAWTRTWQTQNTAIDTASEAAGLPLMAALMLRNFARNIPLPQSSSSTHDSDENLIKSEPSDLATPPSSVIDESFTEEFDPMNPMTKKKVKGTFKVRPLSELERDPVWRAFAPVRDQIYYVMAYNESLKTYLSDLMLVVEGHCS